MTIKIECESGYELSQLLQPMVDAQAEAAQTREKMYIAQDKVRDLEEKLRIANLAKLAEPRPTMDGKLKQLIIAVGKNEKINSIKLVREVLGCGLKEAKDLVEDAYTALPKQVY